IKPEEKSVVHIIGDERYRSRTTSKRVADRHPDWVLKLLPGDEQLHDIYIHMDPHVKGFRQTKVKEAVDLIKKGYDGLRYDNLILLNGIARKIPYTTTYATATQLMLREIKTAIRKINPEAVIMANNAGPDVFNLTDLNMYEAGLSSESHMMEQAGKTDWGKSNYDRAHLRMLTAKCIWQFAGKPFWVWDYPKGKTSKDLEDQWMLRSIIFDLMHDAIIGLAVPEDLKPIKMAAEVSALVGDPLSEIIVKENLVVRYYRPGVILVMETKSKPWKGTIQIPAAVRCAFQKPRPARISYSLFSEDKYKLNCARIHAQTNHCFKLTLDADGCAIIALDRNDQG
ncbi:MAG: hypothetical protein L6437_00375, partial [Kiritimatiellae bacterium]|nr:hypothetical protein [Kiritimatiellia bacterium]